MNAYKKTREALVNISKYADCAAPRATPTQGSDT